MGCAFARGHEASWSVSSRGPRFAKVDVDVRIRTKCSRSSLAC
jgi:hypothetical protein